MLCFHGQTKEKCKTSCYCLSELPFPEGLRFIENELDFADFVGIGYACGCVMDMYVKQFGTANMQDYM